MYGFFAKAIVFFYDVWPSYGGSITLLTLAIMIVLLPLTLKGTRSMIAMQRLQPELKKLQNRYKDDRAKLNEEMLKFYKENKISPLGGCLPMLIQLPVFWVLYEVLLGLTRHGPFGADLGSGMVCSFGNAAQQASQACQHGIYTLGGTFSPSYIHQDSNLWHALHGSRQMMSFGVDLSQTPLASLGGGLVHALPYIAMILVVIATTFIQQKQVQGRTTQASMSSQQQMMMKVMPLAFAVIYVIIPAGVVVYFLVSNLFRIAQQAFITRSMYGPGSGLISTTATDTTSKRTGERKGLLSAFVPSRESLPQIGKHATSDGAKKAGGKGGGAKAGGGKKGGGTATKQAARKGAGGGASRQSSNGRGGPKAGGGNGGAKAGNGAKAETPGRNGRTSEPAPAEATNGAGRASREAPRPAARKGASAPSRRPQGPARKSPPPPNRSRSKKKRK